MHSDTLVSVARALLISAILTVIPATTEASPITIASFSGPTLVAAGESWLYEVVLSLTPTAGLTGETIQSASVTFDSGEGETALAALPGALGATFTFELPGLYTVSLSGAATSIGTKVTQVPYQVAYTEYVPIYGPNGELLGYQTVTRYVTQYRTDYETITQTNSLQGQLQVQVYQPQIITPPDPTPVPEPGSMMLFGIGALGAVAARRHRKNRLDTY